MAGFARGTESSACFGMVEVAWGGEEAPFAENLEEMLENHDGRRPRRPPDGDDGNDGRDGRDDDSGNGFAALPAGMGTGEDGDRGLEVEGDAGGGEPDVGDGDCVCACGCDCNVFRRRLVGLGALWSGDRGQVSRRAHQGSCTSWERRDKPFADPWVIQLMSTPWMCSIVVFMTAGWDT